MGARNQKVMVQFFFIGDKPVASGGQQDNDTIRKRLRRSQHCALQATTERSGKVSARGSTGNFDCSARARKEVRQETTKERLIRLRRARP